MHVRKNTSTARRGTIAVMAALLMVVMVGVLAFSIDLGMVYNTRADLQRSADSGALAAAEELSASGDVVAMGRDFTKRNSIVGDKLNDSDINVQTGVWDRNSRVFSPGAEPANAVKLLVQRTDSPFFFAGVFGKYDYDMTASATAMFQPRDIMLVLDYSGSMLDESKITSLKSAVGLFCDLVRDSSSGHDRIGFVRYSTNATLENSMTFNVDQVKAKAQSGDAAGFTNIGDGLKMGIDQLKNNGRTRCAKLILLLTDGLANRPSNKDPVAYVKQQANRAATENVPVFSIAFGSDADNNLMKYVADKTKSEFFHVDSFGAQEGALEAVFRRVALSRPLQLVD